VSKLAIALLVIVALACAKKDPFDDAVIAKDLQKRTSQEIHDAADKFTYDPPADRLLTEKQIADYVQMSKLSAKIRSVAERRLNEQVDRASNESGRTARLGESLAAIGSMRAYATADLRAALTLGLNPREEEWVARHIGSGIRVLDQMAIFEKQIAEAKTEVDAEIDPLLVERKKAVYDRTVDEQARWEQSQDPADVANAKRVRMHRHELVTQ
jgi:hypothetical protein